MLRGILLTDCHTSTDILNHMLESQAQFVLLISVRVSLIIGKFPKGNGKIISCPFKDGFHSISALFDTDKGMGRGKKATMVQTQNYWSYLAGILSQWDNITALKLPFHRISPLPPTESARCCPETWSLKQICHKHVKIYISILCQWGKRQQCLSWITKQQHDQKSIHTSS